MSGVITDGQRREVAASLREAVADAKNTGCLLDAEVLSILGVDSGDLDGSSDPEDVMHLADLIDRPTCYAALCYGGFYGCTRCGYFGWTDKGSVTNYCPVCGAEVVAE